MSRSLVSALLAATSAHTACSSDWVGTVFARRVQASSVSYSALPTGNVFSDFILNGGVSYYSFAAPVSFGAVRITLTPLYGNPDLYVCVGGGSQACATDAGANSTATPFAYSSVRALGPDVVDISAFDTAVRTVCTRGSRSSGSCSFRVAVAARNAAAAGFRLVVIIDDQTVALPNGVALFGASAPRTVTAYTFSATAANASAPVSFMLTPITGATNVAIASAPGVGMPSFASPASVCTSFVAPDAANPTASRVRATLAYVPVVPGDACFCAPPCTYSVAVSSSGSSQYTLAA